MCSTSNIKDYENSDSFDCSIFSLNIESLKEILHILANKNSKRIELSTKKDNYLGLLNNEKLIETIFYICEKYKLPKEASYLTQELFGEFLKKQISELHHYISTHNSSPNICKPEKWLFVKKRITNQVYLRMLSCCQVASKFVTNYNFLTSKKLEMDLKELGILIKKDAILQSELRILKILNYKIFLDTPLIYLDTLLAWLKKNITSQFEFDLKTYRMISLKLLDEVYIRQHSIYLKFLQISQDSHFQTNNDKSIFALKNDFMLLGAGIISTAAFIINYSVSNYIVEELSNNILIPTEVIVDMSSALIYIIIN